MKPVEPLGPRSLRGHFVALEPFATEHREGLMAAAEDPAIWRYIPFDVSKGFANRLALFEQENAAGTMMTFAVRRLTDGKIVGSSSYLSITPEHAKVEIGATWYTKDAQATAINPESKYLLLENAFGANYNRIEFKTDSRNARSRAALRKLGAIEEGTLRGHMWVPQGYFRDSVFFSILASEWPSVKAALEERLGAFS